MRESNRSAEAVAVKALVQFTLLLNREYIDYFLLAAVATASTPLGITNRFMFDKMRSSSNGKVWGTRGVLLLVGYYGESKYVCSLKNKLIFLLVFSGYFPDLLGERYRLAFCR